MKNMLAVSTRGFGEGNITTNDIVQLDTGDSVITFTTEIITLPGPTRNGVLYPLEEMKKAVNDDRIQQMLRTGSMYGEEDHPLNPEDLRRWTRVEMRNATHKWLRFWFEGNTLMGECQTYSGNGNILWHAIKNGELPSFSIRVLGNPKEAGEYTELRDIVLIAVDWVRYPGNPGSFVTDSFQFNVQQAPIVAGFNYESRIVPKAESMNILGLGEKQEVVNLGKGCYTVINRVSDDEYDRIIENRANLFI